MEDLDYYDYTSWISNVSGRLFFHLTDGYNFRYDRIVGDVLHFNKRVGEDRVVFISILADLRDLEVKDEAKYTRIVMFGRTHCDDTALKFFKGDVYLIDDINNNGLNKDLIEKTFLYEIRKLMAKHKKLVKDDIEEKILEFEKELYSSFETTTTKLLYDFDQDTTKTIKRIEFKIKDTGITFLKKVDEHKVISKIRDSDISMAFYFLKFTFHKDRYHHHSEENIVKIIPLTNLKKEKRGENISRNLLIGIKRYIAENRKLREDLVSDKLKGIISYTKAFLGISYKENWISPEDYKAEINFMSTLEGSIDRALDKKPSRPGTIYQLVSELQSISVMLLAVVAPYLIISSRGNENFIYEIFISTYLYAFLSVLVLVEVIRLIYTRSISSSYIFSPIYKSYVAILIFLKKHSNPNIYSKFNPKYYISWIINIEMYFRRRPFWLKITYAVLAVMMYIYIIDMIVEVFYPEEYANIVSWINLKLDLLMYFRG